MPCSFVATNVYNAAEIEVCCHIVTLGGLCGTGPLAFHLATGVAILACQNATAEKCNVAHVGLVLADLLQAFQYARLGNSVAVSTCDSRSSTSLTDVKREESQPWRDIRDILYSPLRGCSSPQKKLLIAYC